MMWVEHVLTAQNKMAIWTRGIIAGTYILDTRYICVTKAYEVTKCILMLYHTPFQHRQSVSLQSELYCFATVLFYCSLKY